MSYKRLISVAIILVVVLAMGVVTRTEEAKKSESLGWLKYDEGLKLAAKVKKPMMVDFYTDWCGYCKKMDKMTYTDSTVAKYIRSHFVAIKVNAESKEMMPVSSGSMNGAQVARSYGVRGYPTIWFLESDGTKIENLPGYAPPDKFIFILRWIGDGIYKTTSWNDYYTKASQSN